MQTKRTISSRRHVPCNIGARGKVDFSAPVYWDSMMTLMYTR